MKNILSLNRRSYWLLIFLFPFLIIACDNGEDPEPLPAPSFTYAPSEIIVGEVVTFTNTSENSTAFQWNFGNGETSTDENPTIIYEESGSYTVTLIATGPGGEEQATMSITVDEPDFLFIDSWDYDIVSADLSNGETTVEIDLDIFGRGIALDTLNNVLYYTDEDNGKIWKSGLDGSNAEAILDIVEAFSIELDIAGGKMYIPDRETSSVFVANLDGSNLQTLFDASDGLEQPTDVALDLVNNKIYISDVGLSATNFAGDGIWQGNFDGSGLTQVIVGGGYSLAVDPEGGMLYFNDAFIGENISMAPLTDFNAISTFATLTEPRSYGIEILANHVYWTDLGEELDPPSDGRIYRAGLDGSGVEQLAAGIPEPRHFIVYK